MASTAHQLTTVVGNHILSDDSRQDGLPASERVREATARVHTMRDLATTSVAEWFALAMGDAVADLVSSLGHWAHDDTLDDADLDQR